MLGDYLWTHFSIYLLIIPQLTIEASDQALPDDRVTTATIVVTVPRDRQAPTFDRAEITAQLTETRNVGETVTNFRARDENLQVGS